MMYNLEGFIEYSFLFSILVSVSYSCPPGYSGTPCQDIQPPVLSCPGPTIETSTDKGKPTAKVIWSVQVTDNSVQVDPNAVIRIRSSNQSGQELPIGGNVVKVTATDEAGNMATCSFHIVVRDLEPPSCSFCPGDIVREELKRRVRVNWERPICSDNSGRWPTVLANRQSGDLFDVPGSYHIQYTLNDMADNVYRNCSFRITLKVKTCPMFTPPLNGALVCNSIDYNSVCAVFCKTGTDFVYNPPLLYYCWGAEWGIWPPGAGQVPPWPDCSGSVSPSWIKNANFHWYYYNGDAHDPSVQEVIKSQFHGLLTSPQMVPFSFCPYPTCNKDEFTVSPGVTG
ncbi:sushi, von Willebrand factor type A, EGF and pentraxin domain-containing protein 1-like [Orbicella faveolata]|uniref:sushi, von Willebrand factor type A, EGF and pentraxin domain-containing protein 1-like n=1 Tax=Orbicella faveolata TaxID=48498 RepID=UPI0009E4397A|nr:sushi, von Willebrand factor type A, EGF and pentraxin domain-containing protein 1-like [Orbicella faveolata]